MKRTSDEIQFVPYIQSGEPPRRAGLVRVDVNLDGLSDNDIQVMGHFLMLLAVSQLAWMYRR